MAEGDVFEASPADLATYRRAKQEETIAARRELVWYTGNTRNVATGSAVAIVHSYGVEVLLTKNTTCIVPWHQITNFVFQAEDRICRGDK